MVAVCFRRPLNSELLHWILSAHAPGTHAHTLTRTHAHRHTRTHVLVVGGLGAHWFGASGVRSIGGTMRTEDHRVGSILCKWILMRHHVSQVLWFAAYPCIRSMFSIPTNVLSSQVHVLTMVHFRCPEIGSDSLTLRCQRLV